MSTRRLVKWEKIATFMLDNRMVKRCPWLNRTKNMKEEAIITPISTIPICGLSAPTLELVERAKSAAAEAYAPYSKFRVGCAVRLRSGAIVAGSNQENAAYPSGLCAERTTLFYAGAQYPNDPVEELVVLAMKEDGVLVQRAAPCGGCRQVMVEVADRFDSPFRVIMAGPESALVVPDCRHLLPITFDSSSL